MTSSMESPSDSLSEFLSVCYRYNLKAALACHTKPTDMAIHTAAAFIDLVQKFPAALHLAETMGACSATMLEKFPNSEAPLQFLCYVSDDVTHAEIPTTVKRTLQAAAITHMKATAEKMDVQIVVDFASDALMCGDPHMKTALLEIYEAGLHKGLKSGAYTLQSAAMVASSLAGTYDEDEITRIWDRVAAQAEKPQPPRGQTPPSPRLG